jgi:opacity protein-like surface antigen
MAFSGRWFFLVPLLFGVQVYGGTLGLSLGYFVGAPVGGATGAGTVTWSGDTFSVEVKEGPDFKSSFGNLDTGIVLNFGSFLSVEGGVEVHGGYKNEETVVVGRVLQDGTVEHLDETIAEDSVEASMVVIYCGGRVGLPFRGRFKPYAAFGPALSLTRLEGLDLKGEIKEIYTKGSNFGFYVGGGVEYFLSDKVALDFPVKYRLFFNNPQTLHVEWFDTVDEFDAEIKPVPVLSLGGGIGFYVF